MLTHDSERCLIQNGGPEEGPDEGDDDNDDQEPANSPPQNQGVHIEEIHDDQINEEHAEGPIGDQHIHDEEHEDINADMDDEVEVDELWSGESRCAMYSDELNMDEMYAYQSFVPRPDGCELLKRKAWMQEAT